MSKNNMGLSVLRRKLVLDSKELSGLLPVTGVAICRAAPATIAIAYTTKDGVEITRLTFCDIPHQRERILDTLRALTGEDIEQWGYTPNPRGCASFHRRLCALLPKINERVTHIKKIWNHDAFRIEPSCA